MQRVLLDQTPTLHRSLLAAASSPPAGPMDDQRFRCGNGPFDRSEVAQEAPDGLDRATDGVPNPLGHAADDILSTLDHATRDVPNRAEHVALGEVASRLAKATEDVLGALDHAASDVPNRVEVAVNDVPGRAEDAAKGVKPTTGATGATKPTGDLTAITL